MLGKLLIFNLISFNTVCNTNTNTNANEIKALTRIESEKKLDTWESSFLVDGLPVTHSVFLCFVNFELLYKVYEYRR